MESRPAGVTVRERSKWNRIWSPVAILVALGSGPCSLADADFGDGSVADAQVVVDMLLAHDRSIESLWWRQSLDVSIAPPGGWRHTFGPTSPEPAEVLRSRATVEWSEVCVDRRKRALVRWEVRHIRSCQWLDDGSASPEFAPTESYEGVDDGVIRTVLRTSAPDGPVLAVRGAGVHVCGLHAIPTPLRALGRHLDLTGRPLGEVLRTAHDLRVASVHDPDGECLVTLSGTANFGGPWGEFSVIVDLARGGCPRLIEVRHPFVGSLIWRIVVQDVRQVGGIWLPVRAMSGMYSLASDPADEDADHGSAETAGERVDALVRAHLQIHTGPTPFDLEDPGVRRAWADALRIVHGPDGPPCVVSLLHWIEVTEVISMNGSLLIEDRIDAWRVPGGARIRERWSVPWSLISSGAGGQVSSAARSAGEN